MVTEATKKYREVFAYGLLAVAALYVISGLSLLFKSGDDLGGAGFADKAALFGYLFTHPLVVVSLFVAVLVVTGWGEYSKNAKTIVTIALGLGAVALLLGVVCWLSAFGADTSGGSGIFNGVFGAGKIVGIFLGLAQLLLLGLVTFYAFTVFQALPKPVRAQQAHQAHHMQHGQWGQQAGWGAQGGWGQQQGGYDQGGQQAGQAGQAWGQPAAPSGQPAQQWGQGYDQGQQPGWGQGSYDQGQQQAWDAASPGAASTGGWGEQPGTSSEQAQQPSGWSQPEQPSGWGQSEQAQQSWGSHASETPESQHGWGAAAQEPGSSYPTAAESGTSGTEETQLWSGQPEATAPQTPESAVPQSDQPDLPAETGQPGEPEDERRDDEQQPPQQGWWQQPKP